MYAREVSDAAQRTAAELRLEAADAKARAKRAGVELRQRQRQGVSSAHLPQILNLSEGIPIAQFAPGAQYGTHPGLPNQARQATTATPGRPSAKFAFEKIHF